MAKKKQRAPVAAPKQQQNAKPNPFDIKKSKTKFDTLGRRVAKAVTIKTGAAVQRVS